MDAHPLTTAKTIAVVGLSPDPTRTSHAIASYLQEHGYHIIPINPNAETILGEKSYPTLSAIPPTIHIDIVDIFRKSEFVPDIVKEAIQRKEKPMIWMQEGVISHEAKQIAESHGLVVAMDICIMKEHTKIVAS